MKKLETQDFEKAAKLLGCSVAAIRAVAEVESRGDGFYPDGFPTILFERHKFAKYTNGKYVKFHPEICNWNAGGYGRAGANQRRKFSLAFSLDKEAAMKSCSWGKFQVMGFNHEICGFETVGEFVDAMKVSEGEHLLAFCRYVKGNGLDKYLRSLNWARFALGYNGAGYKKNNYDRKMAAAYAKYSKMRALTDVSQPETGNPEASAENPPSNETSKEATAGMSFKDFTDKYLKHAKTDSAKNILLVISGRIGASISALFASGITGKLFLILLSLVIIGFLVYAFLFYRQRIFGWIKTIFDSLLN